ncbi:MAG: hypothetical protein R3Y56_09285 [Akkermansia sp.]
MLPTNNYQQNQSQTNANTNSWDSPQDEEKDALDYEEEQRTQKMFPYVDPPLERNGLKEEDYKSSLSTHYKQSNKYWDRFKTPAPSNLQSPEEVEQQKKADGYYEQLRNDTSTDYSQRPFEEQQAREISKITYKTDFQRIMNEPDARRMNIINKMVRNRTKL